MKSILITGARSGIMAAVIKRIKRKYKIYVTVHTEEQLNSVVKKYQNYPNIECFKLDVTNLEDRKKLEQLDIDVLICNAAIGSGGSIAEIPMNKVRNDFEVNVFSNFEVIQIVLKKMVQKDSGKVIIMGSLAGLIPIRFLDSYCANKASIIKLAETLRQEMKIISNKIKVVLIEPGLYHTGFNQVMLENKYDWMQENSYFKNELDYIRKSENIFIRLFESNNFDKIAKPIVKAIKKRNPKFLIRTPFYQVLGVKMYLLFKA